MHCDSLVGAETGEGESGEGPIVHEPPRRVLTKLPNTQVEGTYIIYMLSGNHFNPGERKKGENCRKNGGKDLKNAFFGF